MGAAAMCVVNIDKNKKGAKVVMRSIINRLLKDERSLIRPAGGFGKA